MRPVQELLGNLQVFAQVGALEIEADMPYQQQANVQYLRTLVDLHTGMTGYEAGAYSQNPATILQNLVALGYDRFANVGLPGDMPEALGDLFEATSGALHALQGAPAAGQAAPRDDHTGHQLHRQGRSRQQGQCTAQSSVVGCVLFVVRSL